MKKYICFILMIILCCSLTACTDSYVAEDNGETKFYELYIEIQSEKNLIFSKYDLSVYVDNEYQISVKHGKTDFFEMDLEEGEHEIKIEKKNDDSVMGTVTLDVTENAEYYYRVKCKKDEILIDQVEDSLIDDEKRIRKKSDDSVTDDKKTAHTYSIDYKNAELLEMALHNGEEVNGKIVQFEVAEYDPMSVLGINCHAGENLNFISEDELNVNSGDIIIGKIIEEASKIDETSWNIPFKMIEITEDDIIEYKADEELSESIDITDDVSDMNDMSDMNTTTDAIDTTDNADEQEKILTENQTMIPASESSLKLDNVNDVVELFNEAGFTNVQLQAIYDLDCTSFWSKLSLEEVEDVYVNESSDFEQGDIVEKDVPVSITYHLFEKDNPDIKYNKYTVAELFKHLDDNPMKAEEDHKNEYAEITGTISGISKHGEYILLYTSKEAWMEWDTIYCETITKEQEEYLLNLSKGQKITLRGKIKSVDIIYPYTMDIYEFCQ